MSFLEMNYLGQPQHDLQQTCGRRFSIISFHLKPAWISWPVPLAPGADKRSPVHIRFWTMPITPELVYPTLNVLWGYLYVCISGAFDAADTGRWIFRSRRNWSRVLSRRCSGSGGHSRWLSIEPWPRRCGSSHKSRTDLKRPTVVIQLRLWCLD